MAYFTLNSMFIHFVKFLLIALVAMLGQLDQLLGIFYKHYRLAHPQIFIGLPGNVIMRLYSLHVLRADMDNCLPHIAMRTVSWIINFSCLCVLPFHKPGNKRNCVEKQYPLKVLASSR